MDRSELLLNHSRRSAYGQYHAQILFAFASVVFGVFCCLIISRPVMRLSPDGFFQHLCLGQREKFRIPVWSPRKCVDPIKSEDVVDTENVEDSFYATDPLSPPGKILRAHRRPVIDRNSPVLSPLDRELVILEIRFRLCAPRPIEM